MAVEVMVAVYGALPDGNPDKLKPQSWQAPLRTCSKPGSNGVVKINNANI